MTFVYRLKTKDMQLRTYYSAHIPLILTEDVNGNWNILSYKDVLSEKDVVYNPEEINIAS